VDGTEIETDLWCQFPDAIRIEVLSFPSDKVAKKYPEGSKVRSTSTPFTLASGAGVR